MRKLLVILICCVAFTGFSQADRVVKLKNGSEIRGTIQNTNENQTTLLTRDGSILVFKSEEIASIEKFVPKVSSAGVFTRASIGVLGGDQLSPSIQLTNGYSFNPHWDLGFKTGIETIWWNWYVPVMASARYNLLKRSFTPFVNVDGGYEIPMSNWEGNKGGITSSASIGVTKVFGNRVGFSTSVGYRFARLVEENQWWDDFRTIRQINRVELRFAFTFK
ncbi:MAG: hypothetical protein ABJG68_03260 [Crocinitomicaceae bacterium]